MRRATQAGSTGPHRNFLLRRERERRCWSQEQMAERVGTTPLNVSRWERGVTSPNPHFRRKLCELFEKSAEDLGLLPDIPPGPALARAQAEMEAAGQPEEVMADRTVDLCRGLVDSFPPPPPHELIGRMDLLRSLREKLCDRRGAVTLALSGLPGVGKTAVALELARDPSVLATYPDGVLWAGLGCEPNLIGQLRNWGAALGITSHPADDLMSVEAWGRVLRAAIGPRQLLLALDDVWGLEDALALKIGGPNCSYLITTRFPSIALWLAADGAIQLKELSEDEGMTLLARLIPEVVASEPEATRELARSVGGLPLALRLIASYLKMQSHTGQPRRLRAALGRLHLAEERLQLAEPQAPCERPPYLPAGTPLSLHAAIAVSERQLDARAQAVLRALAAFPPKPNSFSEEAAVAVTGQPPEALDTLSDAGLIESYGPGRYMIHQTIADYARLHHATPATYERMAAYYATYVAEHARDYRALNREINNIAAAFQASAKYGLTEHLARGVNATIPFLEARGSYSLAESLLRLTPAVTGEAPDESAAIMTWLHLGHIAELRGELAHAEELYERGFDRARAIGEKAQMVALLAHWGEVAINRGNHRRAEGYLRKGLALARAIGNRQHLGLLLRLLGEAAECGGKHARGERLYLTGLAHARETGDLETVGACLQNLGEKAMREGRDRDAHQYFADGLEVARTIGHRQRISALLTGMGVYHTQQQRYEEARALLRESIEIAEMIGHQIRMTNALLGLGKLAYSQRRDTEAVTYFSQSLELARAIGNPFLVSDSLCDLGEVHLRHGYLGLADRAFSDARDTVEALKALEMASLAPYGLARVAAARGDAAHARALGQESLALLRAEGNARAGEVAHWLAGVSRDERC